LSEAWVAEFVSDGLSWTNELSWTKEITAMKTMQTSADNVQEPKREAQQRDVYRAPRLVPLGTAVGLVQYLPIGRFSDYQNRAYG
jgi:hypothetical protein